MSRQVRKELWVDQHKDDQNFVGKLKVIDNPRTSFIKDDKNDLISVREYDDGFSDYKSAEAQVETAYNKIIDDLDDAETLTFASIQTVCSRQLRRRHRVRADSPRDRADTPRATPLSSPAKPDKYKKYKTQGAPDTSPSYVTPSPTTVFGPRTLTKRPASTSWTILPFSTPSSPRPSLPSRHLARLPVTPMMRGNVQGFV